MCQLDLVARVENLARITFWFWYTTNYGTIQKYCNIKPKVEKQQITACVFCGTGRSTLGVSEYN